jgi:dipeptidyl aminopeptidase/acylaminoacyl peptidase
MRMRDYPGSEVTREQELEPGANYDRFRASYYSDGLKIYALLTVPRGEPPAEGWPVVVFNHGYIPPDEYRTTERYVAYVDHLARHGYIVFRPDYRGHDQSEGVASGAYGSPDYVVDVLNAVAAMRRFPEADPDRIGMWGHSMGGYITLRAMVIDPQIRAGVIWAGVVGSYPDLMYRWRRTPTPGPGGTPFPGRGWRGGLAEAYGSPEENPAFWASISANSFLADLSGPVQLHHGTADSSVPHLFSELLAGEIEQAGGVVELYLYPGADHNLSQPFSVAMQRTLNFFDMHLKVDG